MNFFDYNNYYSSIFLINVFSYIILLFGLFIIFFIFDIKYIKTLNDLKFFGNLPLITISITISLLSFAGIPPLLGFLSKFFIFVILLSKSNLYYTFIFIFSNMFIIYFCIQNLRFITSKRINNKMFVKNNIVLINQNILFSLNILNLLNLFFIFYIEDFIITFIYLFF